MRGEVACDFSLTTGNLELTTALSRIRVIREIRGSIDPIDLTLPTFYFLKEKFILRTDCDRAKFLP